MKGALLVAASVAIAPVALVVLLGAGFAAAAEDAGTVPPAPDGDPAETVPGSGGCTLHDPSGTGGCVTPALAGVMRQVTLRFGPLPVSCWNARGGDPYSDHPKGRACDYTAGRIGRYPGPVDVQRGWVLATWTRARPPSACSSPTGTGCAAATSSPGSSTPSTTAGPRGAVLPMAAVPESLLELTTSLDDTNGRHVLDAVAHRFGWHEYGFVHTVTGRQTEPVWALTEADERVRHG